jgi:single-strand DNA-binding protein
MANFNKVLLIGNLTKDPELRYTPQGTAVVNLRLAVNRRFRDRNQETKEEVCFLTVVVWDRQAESCNQFLHKGSPVFVEGRLQSRSWEDNAGQKRNVLEVRAERVQFLSAAPAKTAVAGVSSEERAPEVSSEETWLGESEEKLHDEA